MFYVRMSYKPVLLLLLLQRIVEPTNFCLRYVKFIKRRFRLAIRSIAL